MGFFGSSNKTTNNSAGENQVASSIDSNLACLEIDRDGNVTAANQRFVSLTGMAEDEVVGTNYASLYDEASQMMSDARSSGHGFCSGIKRGAGKVSADLVSLVDASGAVTGFHEISRSISAREVADDQTGLVNAINRSEAVIFFEPDGTILGANENFCGAMGYEEKDIVGQHHRIFVDPADSQNADYTQFWADIRDGKFQSGDFRRRNRDGDDVWINASYNPIFDEHGNVVKVVKVASDITDSRRAVEALTHALTRLSDGDLATRIDAASYSSLNEIHNNFNDTMGRLSQVIMAIKTSAEGIDEQTGEIERAAGDMSRRTESQAASLEETTASMEEIAGNVATNDETARVAASVAGDAASRAETGRRIVSDAVSAMTRIEESSSKITEIVTVIESIAFQTNLLALNAAVEAARAGEAGKGFAVVASEVRSLAQRASDAARDITGLIRDSVDSVNEGATLVRNTGSALDEINNAIVSLVSHVGDISDASQSQTSSISAVSSSLTNIDQSTQQNAQLADSFATNARRLNELVSELGKLARMFQTGADKQANDGSTHRAVA